MKATELRKGNIIQDTGGVKHIVESIFASGIHDEHFNGYPYYFLEGVEITKEFLLVNNFKNGCIYSFQKEAINHIKIEFNQNLNCFINGVSIDIKYIHQLQNLWHSLTNESLIFID